jgi:hypothetical protein
MPDAAAAAAKTETAPAAQADAGVLSQPQSQQPQATPAKNDAAPAKADAPIVYDLKLPDGSPLNADTVKQATEMAKKLGLSPAHAQALLIENSNAIAAQRAAEAKQMADQDAAWQKELAGDPEVGGPKLAATVTAAKRGFAAAPKDVQALITEGGFQNHPGFIKLFAQLGGLLGEDGMGGKAGGTAPASAAKLYPSMPNP